MENLLDRVENYEIPVTVEIETGSIINIAIAAVITAVVIFAVFNYLK